MSPSESGRNPSWLWMWMPFGQVLRNEFRSILKQPSGLTKVSVLSAQVSLRGPGGRRLLFTNPKIRWTGVA